MFDFYELFPTLLEKSVSTAFKQMAKASNERKRSLVKLYSWCKGLNLPFVSSNQLEFQISYLAMHIKCIAATVTQYFL